LCQRLEFDFETAALHAEFLHGLGHRLGESGAACLRAFPIAFASFM
jgi:hypothetical protein